MAAETANAQQEFILLNWNVLNKNSADVVVRSLAALQGKAGNFDIGCLQEVSVDDQADPTILDLAQAKLGLQGKIAVEHEFRPSLRRFTPAGKEAISTLSRLAIKSSDTRVLSTGDPTMLLFAGRTRRVCLLTEHAVPEWEKPLTVGNVHLSLAIPFLNRRQRREENDAIIDLTREHEENFVLAGDFNAKPESKLIQAILERMQWIGTAGQATHANRYLGEAALQRTVDYIFTTPDFAGELQIYDAAPSDHKPLLARIRKR